MSGHQVITVVEAIVVPLLLINAAGIVQTAYAAASKAGLMLLTVIHPARGRAT